jgi:murein DD-endopeptidase
MHVAMRRLRPVPAIALTLAALFALAVLAPRASRAQARAPLVQSVEMQVPFAPASVRIAGKRYLVYELHLTNLRSVDVSLTRVEVVDADRRTRVAEYRGPELARWLGRPGVTSDGADRRLIGGGMRAILYAWLPLDDGVATPARLAHRIELDAARPRGREHAIVEGGAADVRRQRPVVLDAPVRGGPWVALYDPSMAGGHRTSIYTIDGRARIPARFAIDLVKLGKGGSRARGDRSAVASWYGHGAEVLAVADAVVADVRDDMRGADTVGASQGPVPLENASGNYVVLDLGGGRHAFYEHLQHGSLRVKRGDRVKRGQVIARLGNTGSSSSGPHLHFHVSDGVSPLAAEGLPYELRRFEVLGAFEDIAAATRDAPWKAVPRAAGGARTTELPAPSAVVMFP